MALDDYLRGSIAVLNEALAGDLATTVERAIALLTEALAADRMVLVCGNGGSAADAQHIAGELVGRYLKDRRAYKVVALGADAAVMTAWSNDFAFETAFARQVEALGEAGGVLLAITTSGNSANVLKAAEAARAKAMAVVGLSGRGGGRLAPLCDCLVAVPSSETPRVQEVHTALYHYMCERLEQALSGSD